MISPSFSESLPQQCGFLTRPLLRSSYEILCGSPLTALAVEEHSASVQFILRENCSPYSSHCVMFVGVDDLRNFLLHYLEFLLVIIKNDTRISEYIQAVTT